MEPLFYINQEIKENPIIIYGTGEMGLSCLNELVNIGVEVEGFCTIKSQEYGTIIQGKRVLSFEELLEEKNYNVIITVEDYESVSLLLKEKSTHNPFIYRDIYNICLL